MTVNYLIIAQHLTGDSEIHFFPTPELAKARYEELTEPLLAICRAKSLEEDEVFSIDADGKGCRFNAGYDEDIDNTIGDVDHWFKWDSAEKWSGEESEDPTHYVADFCEYVDDSTISFWTEDKAKAHYETLVNNEIDMANERGHKISRSDPNTWDNGEGMTLFQETDTKEHSECYFGWCSDPTNTIRIGKIK